MGKEILAVPEYYLGDVIRVIRYGLIYLEKLGESIDPVADEQLRKWCKEEEEYLGILDEE